MGKCKNATKGDRGTHKGPYPTLSSHGCELGDTAQDLMKEVASVEEVFSHMGTSSKTPFRFTQLSISPPEWSLSPEH